MSRPAHAEHLTPTIEYQQSRLGEIEREELAEITLDARVARTPKSLPKKYLGDE